MTNMTNDEIAEMIAERNGNQHYCKNCDDCCQPYDSTDDCFKSAMQAMELKDKQFAQEKQQWIEKACEWWTNNWRKYVMTDRDGIVALCFWKDDFKKAMKGE